MSRPDPFDPATIAADYALAAIGRDHAAILVAALTAGWMTDTERATLRGLAVGVAYLAGLPHPVEATS